MAKKELPFGKYKRYLLDYLHAQGIKCELNQVTNCPWHEDSTPSFSVFVGDLGELCFNCFGCGRAGDIYKAVEYCEGETDAKKQFERIEAIYGNGESFTSSFVPKTSEKKETVFPVDKEAFSKFTDFLKNQPRAKENILSYFSQRAQIKSDGEIFQYPKEITDKVADFFYWYPGKKQAENALGKVTLLKAGLPSTSKTKKLPEEKQKIAWYHSGVLAKSPEGFKLLFMDGTESRKINPRAGVSYCPIPSEIPENVPVILLEGEIDAILCQCLGYQAYSMGGKGGLTKSRIEKYIVSKNIPEIILFADNDKDFGSQKKFGLLPVTKSDHIRETVPENLIKMGYKGKIRVTVLPENCGFKDPDDAIRVGNFDIVRQAIENARDYIKPTTPESSEESLSEKKREKARKNAATRLTEDLLSQILSHKKLQKQNMSDVDTDTFARAVRNALPEILTDAQNALLEAWGVSAEIIDNPGTMPPDQIIRVIRSYKAPRSLLEKVCDALSFEPPVRKEQKTVFPIDFAEIKKLQAWKEYLYSGQSQYAASVCCHIFDGKLVYDSGKNQFFRYVAPVWIDEPNVDKLVTDTLTALIDNYYKKAKENEKVALERYRKEAADKTFQRKVTDSIRKDTEHDIWKRTIEFDNPNLTNETLTLLDSVLDFSGAEPGFRDAKPSEYRMHKMPFTRTQLEHSEEPKNYIKFIQGNFTDPATLEMFERFISLIPARTAKYKIAAFLNGGPNTGKSTTMRVLKAVYTYWQEYPVGEPESLVKSIPSDIVLKERNQTKSDDGRSPTLASIVNAGAAFCDETDNMQKIDAKLFKRFTGGSTISFRDNYESMKEHSITAQLILGTNELPDIITPGDSKIDEAILARMMIVPFLVTHERSVSEDLMADIRPEFPAIIMRYAKIYCEVRHKFRGNIPQSKLALEWKSKYIEHNKNDIQRFVEERLEAAQGGAETWNALYSAFCEFMEYRLDEFGIPAEKNALTQRKFTAKMKVYFTLEGTNADSIYLNGKSARGLKGYCLKKINGPSASSLDFGPQLISGSQQSNAAQGFVAPPEDDPFANAVPPPVATDDTDESDGEQYDIF